MSIPVSPGIVTILHMLSKMLLIRTNSYDFKYENISFLKGGVPLNLSGHEQIMPKCTNEMVQIHTN